MLKQPTGEPFLAFSPGHNTAVVEWLLANSEHPEAATALWAKLLTLMQGHAGEVVEPSSGLAAHADMETGQVASILDELVSINAIRREHQGGRVRHFVSPWVATYIIDPEAQRAARERASPLLVVMQGGQSREGSA